MRCPESLAYFPRWAAEAISDVDSWLVCVFVFWCVPSKQLLSAMGDTEGD